MPSPVVKVLYIYNVINNIGKGHNKIKKEKQKRKRKRERKRNRKVQINCYDEKKKLADE